MTVRRRAVAALMAMLFLAGCDWFGPSGPGTLSMTISGPSNLGVVLLEVKGPGVEGFVGQGGTRTFSAELPRLADSYRVIAVIEGGGTLQVGIEVVEVSDPKPIVRVLRVASTANLLMPTQGVTVGIETP